MAWVIQIFLYVLQDISENYCQTVQREMQPKMVPFFSEPFFSKNCSCKNAICAQAFFDASFATKKVGKATMMLVSRKKFIGKCSWGKEKSKFLTFLCFVVRADHRGWDHWKPCSLSKTCFKQVSNSYYCSFARCIWKVPILQICSCQYLL